MGAKGVPNFCKAPVTSLLHGVKIRHHFLFSIFLPMIPGWYLHQIPTGYHRVPKKGRFLSFTIKPSTAIIHFVRVPPDTLWKSGQVIMQWQKFSSVFGRHIMVVEFFLPKCNGPFVFFKTFHIFFLPFPCEINEEKKLLLVLSVVHLYWKRGTSTL